MHKSRGDKSRSTLTLEQNNGSGNSDQKQNAHGDDQHRDLAAALADVARIPLAVGPSETVHHGEVRGAGRRQLIEFFGWLKVRGR